jgi:steroid delta-isomerase-like uncharacterized protein
MAPTTAPPENASNVDVARWVIDVINTHDVTPLRERWVDDVVERFPDRTCRGKDELAAYFEGLFAALPDAHMEVVAAFGEGENVFLRWRLTGTHTGGSFNGIEPTGKRIELDGMDHFVIRDGKVVSNFVVFDQMEVGRALGLLPPDGSQADRALKAAFNAKTKIAEAIKQARS